MKTTLRLALAAAALSALAAAHAQGRNDTSAPTASVTSVYVFGTQPPRADLLVDGRIITVAVGDQVQGWQVSSIRKSGVVVEQTRLQPDPLQQRARTGAAQTARESSAWFAPARLNATAPQLVEFRVTHELPSAIENPVSGSTRGPNSAISIQ